MMSLWIIIALCVVTGGTGSPNATLGPDEDPATLLDFSLETLEDSESRPNVSEEAVEDAMATGELNPSHYPAQRAAKVVQHYLNTLHGSPYRVLGLQRVHSAHTEDVADSGRKYRLEVSVRGMMDTTTCNCSAEVTFPGGESLRSAQVHVVCSERLNVNTSVEEEAFYRRYKMNDGLLSAQNLPDSYGHMEPDMKPLWSLGAVASSFVMLNQSTEDTLYNMAQVANVTQLPTENDQLKFDYHVLLHDMVSQDIVHWKLLVTWSPAGGVNVLQMEKLPHCHHCEEPLVADPTAEARNSTAEARNSTAEARNSTAEARNSTAEARNSTAEARKSVN